MSLRYTLTKLGSIAVIAILLQADIDQLPVFAHADRIEAESARIDETKGMAIATGVSALSNQEAANAQNYLRARGFAKLDALRNLTMLVDHVKIESKTFGADYVVKDDTIRAEVKGIVSGARIVEVRKVPMGKFVLIEVTVAAPMNPTPLPSAPKPALSSVPKKSLDYYAAESRATTIATENVPPTRREIHRTPSQPALVHPLPAEPEIVVPIIPRRHGFTSLIVDVRGQRIVRSISPKILRPDGREAWGTIEVDPDFVIEHGIVSYAHSIEEAKELSRAGDHPLVVRSIGVGSGRYNADAVLSYPSKQPISHPLSPCLRPVLSWNESYSGVYSKEAGLMQR